MQEYRAQLDAERASKLARGKNHAPPGTKSKDKDKKRQHSASLSYDPVTMTNPDADQCLPISLRFGRKEC